MTRVAISYRRADAAAMAGRMFDRLSTKFGDESVFMDIDRIPYGTNFRETIERAIGDVDVLLVVIGKSWLEPGASGLPRIAEPDDVLRFEIETALGQDVAIVPVIVDGGTMPGAAQLPESIARFALHNAAEVSSGRDFRVHMDRLIEAIGKLPDRRRKRPAPGPSAEGRGTRERWLELGAYVVGGSIVSVALYFVVAMQFTAFSTALYLAMTMGICAGLAALAFRTHGLLAGTATALAGAIAAITIGMAWAFQVHGNYAARPFLAVPWANSVIGFVAANALAGTVGNLVARARSPQDRGAGLLARIAPGKGWPLPGAAAILLVAALYLAYVAWQPFCLQFGLAEICYPSEP